MIWLSWRQHRTECLIIGAVLGVVAAFLLITGLDMAHTFQQLGLSDCGHRANCASLVQVFHDQFSLLSGIVGGAINFLPILLGILVGAPLVARELEQGTHRLAWTQSVTRFRWLSAKLALVLSIGLLASGILMALLIWWDGPFAQIFGFFTPPSFDFSGPVWLAATVLALALGIFAGTLTRRTVLGMFLTVVLLLVIRMPTEIWLRPNYEPPLTVTWSIDQPGPPPSPDGGQQGSWITDHGWIDVGGNKSHNLNCQPTQSLQQCLKASGARALYLTYQPGNRFWTFQLIETSIYLAFTILALGATVWLVKRRLN
jgi:hypothetical protein